MRTRFNKAQIKFDTFTWMRNRWLLHRNESGIMRRLVLRDRNIPRIKYEQQVSPGLWQYK